MALTAPELDSSGGTTCNRIGCNRDEVKAYPTDAKEREKHRRKKLKESGNEHKVIKKNKIVEDHHDDCGEDLASLMDSDLVGIAYPDIKLEQQHLAVDEKLTYYRNNMLYGDPIPSYAGGLADKTPTVNAPLDALPAAKAPLRAGLTRPTFTDCEGCALRRDPWDRTHSRKVGGCWYPDIAPRSFTCPGCIGRKNRLEKDHTYQYDVCQWGTPDRNAKRTRPHEPVVSPSYEPTAGPLPQDSDGRPLGTAESEAII